MRSPSIATSARRAAAPGAVDDGAVADDEIMHGKERTGPATTLASVTSLAPDTVEEVRKGLADHDYLADEGLATSIFLALRLQRPLLLEGEAGVGKTEVAKVLARWTGGELVRLQCYEGIDASQAVYEWDYSRQLLHLRAVEASHAAGRRGRAVLGAVSGSPSALARAVVRQAMRRRCSSIDEVDRADDEFEAFLLEILSDWSISVPEIGVVRAEVPPIAMLTSNRTPRRARRAEASLPLPLDRAPRLRARARHRARARPGGSRRARSRRCGRGRGVARPRALQTAGCGGDDRLGRGARDARSHAYSTNRRCRRDARHDREVSRRPRARACARARRTGASRGGACLRQPKASGSRSRSRVCCAAPDSTCPSARR